jgi:hypothetical protein
MGQGSESEDTVTYRNLVGITAKKPTKVQSQKESRNEDRYRTKDPFER